jgi:hypothetical protein
MCPTQTGFFTYIPRDTSGLTSHFLFGDDTRGPHLHIRCFPNRAHIKLIFEDSLD